MFTVKLAPLRGHFQYVFGWLRCRGNVGTISHFDIQIKTSFKIVLWLSSGIYHVCPGTAPGNRNENVHVCMRFKKMTAFFSACHVCSVTGKTWLRIWVIGLMSQIRYEMHYGVNNSKRHSMKLCVFPQIYTLARGQLIQVTRYMYECDESIWWFFLAVNAKFAP